MSKISAIFVEKANIYMILRLIVVKKYKYYYCLSANN